MTSAYQLRRHIRRAVLPFTGALALAYFAYHTVNGDRGLVAWWQLRHEMARAETELARLEAQRQALEHRVALLGGDGLDLDMLDERARLMLGYGRPDEIVILYR